jgi:hypothetical protein
MPIAIALLGLVTLATATPAASADLYDGGRRTEAYPPPPGYEPYAPPVYRGPYEPPPPDQPAPYYDGEDRPPPAPYGRPYPPWRYGAAPGGYGTGERYDNGYSSNRYHERGYAAGRTPDDDGYDAPPPRPPEVIARPRYGNGEPRVGWQTQPSPSRW